MGPARGVCRLCVNERRIAIQLYGNDNVAFLKPWAPVRNHILAPQTIYRRGQMQTTTTLANGKNTGFNLTNLAAKAAEGKVLAEDLVDTGKRKAQRIVKRGLDAGEDYLDETRRYIKHHPWNSVGFALGIGLTIGFLGGFLSRRH
jgi:ElaB/YqjD/DUF883 family membrane-anchored ribosome-binding protein